MHFRLLHDLEFALYHALMQYDALSQKLECHHEYAEDFKQLFALVEAEIPKKLTLLVFCLHLTDDYCLRFDPQPPFYQISIEKFLQSLTEEPTVWHNVFSEYGHQKDVKLLLNTLKGYFLDIERVYLHVML